MTLIERGELSWKQKFKEKSESMKTRVTELLGIEYPIIQGAMQYMSLAELAAAVSNAGDLEL